MALTMPTTKDFEPTVVKQEQIDSENGSVIMLPELHIKDEIPVWQKETGSELNSDFSVAGKPLKKSHVNDHSITDSEGTIKYAELKKDLKLFIETTIEEVVERCFQKHFAQLAALIGASKKSTEPVQEPDNDIYYDNADTDNEMDAENQEFNSEYAEVVKILPDRPAPPIQESTVMRSEEDVEEDVPVRKHVKITNEHGLANWNEKLKDEEYFKKCVSYFERIIAPKSHMRMGDKACLTLVTHMFAPELWQKLTWAGHKKANNTKVSFCMFQNVIRLLYKLIFAGDPTYSKQKMEWYIRRRVLYRPRKKLTE